LDSKEKINAYYDQTYHQYRKVWRLDKHLGIHYGYWEKGIRRLSSAVTRMNQYLADKAHFSANSKILDMGCGIGGSSFYLAENYNLYCIGLNLNRGQVDLANKLKEEKNLSDKVSFINVDYLHSNLPDNSFDGIWALETICHCQDKNDFLKEASRLLKPGSTMILAEYFITKPELNSKTSMVKWLQKWAIPSLDSVEEFSAKMKANGFEIELEKDISKNISTSSLYMFISSFPGMITTEINQLFKDYGSYSHDHYKSAFWQYIAFRKKYWRYHVIKARKL
jgi:cyclopropane fatty-acyl-phospholipid synthase-like methyltransferase